MGVRVPPVLAGPTALARVGFFAELERNELEALSACLRRRRYAKGTVIFLEGDPGNSLYVIESGQVKITLSSQEGKELVLALLGPGEFFGDLALLDGEPRSADAVARQDSQLLLLQREDFLRMLEARPRVAIALLAALSRVIRRNTQMLQEAAFLDIPARVASALLKLAETQGRPTPRGVEIDTPLTQSELASLVGATRESVNKWVRFYERQGLLHWGKGSITVLRPDALRARIS